MRPIIGVSYEAIAAGEFETVDRAKMGRWGEEGWRDMCAQTCKEHCDFFDRLKGTLRIVNWGAKTIDVDEIIEHKLVACTIISLAFAAIRSVQLEELPNEMA
jgi:hypothetical protein